MAVHGSIRAYKEWTRVLFNQKKPSPEEINEILMAAESGNLEVFERLYYAEPTRLGIRDSRGRTPAHQAAARNKVNILKFILEKGGDLNNQDNAGNTPLHIAVEYESLDAVDYLLQM
ncbi:hypothetical protein NQ318_016857 [Aromia moschata]|uniref:Uncharacterized protein n=1 Tax=Aromia moschata TaxID=1265417 RepID=A0AAV8YTX3_9CUCU|nr:hypothetical protein NQ318_016857 [Aromia moschata]